MILMDRAEAIAFFESKKTALEKSEHILLGRNAYDAFCSAVDALREQEERKWISVEERLPEEDVDVLTRRATGIDVEHCMGNGKWWNDYYSGRWTVTHWMPLPSAEGLE